MKKYLLLKLLGGSLMILFVAGGAFSQTTEFSYQGFLSDNLASANGNFDFEFRLFENPNGGIATATIARPSILVTNGVFSVVLDFGVFPAANRFLEIGVRSAGGGAFTTLAPRSKILSTPFSTNANSASVAENALQLGGVNAGQFVQTTDPRLSDDRNPQPNSPNYVQNRTTQQTSTNFNISGNGTAGGVLQGGTVTAVTQFNNLNGRILAKFGVNNLYVGTLAGSSNGGMQNTFVGDSAGKTNTGNENAMFGFIAGQDSTSGSNNSFFGSRAGLANLTGGNNSIFGAYANLGANNLTNAAAFGFRAFVESNDSMVLGSVNGKNGANTDTKVGIGTTNPEATLDIEGQLPNLPPNVPNLRLTNYGRFSLIRGRASRGTRTNPTSTFNNDILLTLTSDGYNGTGFTDLGMASIFFRATQNWTSTANGTAIEFGTTQNGTTTEQIRMRIDQNGDVGIGTTSPSQKLDVSGNIRIGTGTTGCVEDRDGTIIAGTCSSDLRFKKNIASFSSVLNNFSKLRPVTYFWRADEFADKNFGDKQSFGLIAQEVEALFPELVSTDEKGYKAVNYSKLPLLTIQAVKELKAENDALRETLQNQQKQLDELKKALEKLTPKKSQMNEGGN